MQTQFEFGFYSGARLWLNLLRVFQLLDKFTFINILPLFNFYFAVTWSFCRFGFGKVFNNYKAIYSYLSLNSFHSFTGKTTKNILSDLLTNISLTNIPLTNIEYSVRILEMSVDELPS